MKWIGTLVMMVIAAIAGKLIYQKIGGGTGKEAELPPGVVAGSREHLLQVAAEINQTLPKKIDREVTVTRVVGRERQLIYQAELATIPGKNIDNARFLNYVTPIIRRNACSEPKMKIFWKHDITATYRFIGSDQFGIGEVSVSRGDCA